MSTGEGEGEERRGFNLVHLDTNHLFHTMISNWRGIPFSFFVHWFPFKWGVPLHSEITLWKKKAIPKVVRQTLFLHYDFRMKRRPPIKRGTKGSNRLFWHYDFRMNIKRDPPSLSFTWACLRTRAFTPYMSIWKKNYKILITRGFAL